MARHRSKEIAQAELEPFGKRVDIGGPPFLLGPELVQPFMLIFHELATNAAKYGAFSTPQGQVQLRWTTTPSRLSVVWRESGGPRVAVPSGNGFGSRLLEKGVPGGVATLGYDPAGFSYSLDIALSERTPDEETNLLQSSETENKILSTVPL